MLTVSWGDLTHTAIQSSASVTDFFLESRPWQCNALVLRRVTVDISGIDLLLLLSSLCLGLLSMTFADRMVEVSPQSLVTAFFQESEGTWHSERRYYTLKSGETEEVVSLISIRFLGAGSDELIQLADLHGLLDVSSLVCGTQVTWESSYVGKSKKPICGSTVFGVGDNLLYRDRGFATSKPVTAQYLFRDPKTMLLKTEYNDSVFEEELKLVGTKYRTRQTIISRSGEELMIGQYLEKRC